MSDVAVRQSPSQDVERHVPAGARPLGVKVKPTLRLGLGFKDPDRGFPIKTDHFTIRGDNDRALAKFAKEYGDEPKAVDITLRPELGTSLDIRYRAFGGGQHGDGGGMVKAVGHTNFALLDWMGGPDTITVFGPNGVEEIEISGKDDEQAVALGIELAAQFTFGLPKVLSYGSVAAVSTRGKESIDTLWAKLREWHALAAWLQAPISRVTGQPLLVLKPSSMMAPKLEGKGTNKHQVGWQKSPLWVLDLLLQETQDEMVSRVMAERQKTLDQGGAQALLYGPGTQRAIAAAAPVDVDFDADEYEPVEGEVVPDDEDTDVGANDAADTQQAAEGEAASGDEPLTDGAPSAAPGPPAPAAASEFKVPAAAVTKAGKTRVPRLALADGAPDVTLAEITSDGGYATKYFPWALRQDFVGEPDFTAALSMWVQAKHPDIWKAAKA